MGTSDVISNGSANSFASVSRGRHVSALRMFLNTTGCLLILPAFYFATVQTMYPTTLDIIIGIILTEYNRYANEGRRMSFYSTQNGPVRQKNDPERAPVALEKGQPVSKLTCMAAVVGYREDTKLFTRALESYKGARGNAFMLIGIDGDDAEDEDMVDVFNKVYPFQSRVLRIEEPLAEVAQRAYAQHLATQREQGLEIDEDKCSTTVVQYCMKLARDMLDEERIILSGPNGVKHLCLAQRHMHKKGIMFTTFIFALTIADILGIEFLWSSDSDTLVFEDTLERSISTIAGDPTVGGSSTGLTVHNGDETVVTSLAATVYWAELYLTRSSPACTATSDCQSGPCTAFRLSSMPSILMPWYMQRVFGKRMIVNEDRHLTSNLLVRGWGVVFASDVLTATETPTTTTRWLRQQVRWARATHLESLLIPRIYVVSHPMAFFAAARREVGPLVVLVTVLVYLFTSHQLLYFSYSDLLLRICISLCYNVLRNPDRLRLSLSLWIVPGMFFYNVPLPAVHLWSLLTMTSDTWGTAMRASTEMSKRDSTRKKWFETGFFVVWMGIVGGALARWAMSETSCSPSQRLLFIISSMVVTTFGSWRITIGSE